MKISKKIYLLSENLPSEERVGLTSQMRRAPAALPAKVAGGFRKRHPREYRQFLHISLGSSAELETTLELAKSIYQINGTETNSLLKDIEEFQRMTMSLSSRLSNP